ncbi:MAG: hypothetical protein ACQESR_12030 [Planctomycetota bacterium]
MERCPTQAVLPLVGLAAEKVIRDRHISDQRNNPSDKPRALARRKPSSRWSDSRRRKSSATSIITEHGK